MESQQKEITEKQKFAGESYIKYSLYLIIYMPKRLGGKVDFLPYSHTHTQRHTATDTVGSFQVSFAIWHNRRHNSKHICRGRVENFVRAKEIQQAGREERERERGVR